MAALMPSACSRRAASKAALPTWPMEMTATSVHSIEASVGDLNTARQELIATVRNLAEIAEQNAKTTQEVSANTNVVTEEFTKIKNSSTGLQDIAEELEVSTKYFSVTVQK